MDIAISSLTEPDSEEAVAVLVHAFMPDPIFSHLFPRVSDRAGVFASFFGALVAINRPAGHVYIARRGRALVATAVWRPPGAPEVGEPEQVLEREAVRRVEAIDFDAAHVLVRGFESLEAGHPGDPHWYLCFMGVDPALQGQGIGGRLLAPVLRDADTSGTLCYLETPFPRTHPFYRGLGFEITSTGHPFVGAPPLWTMLRRPR
jgi:GNAT superfamily N-acetyltransferase